MAFLKRLKAVEKGIEDQRRYQYEKHDHRYAAQPNPEPPPPGRTPDAGKYQRRKQRSQQNLNEPRFQPVDPPGTPTLNGKRVCSAQILGVKLERKRQNHKDGQKNRKNNEALQPAAP